MKFLTLVERVTFIEGLGMTMIVLVSAEHISRAAGVEWPVNLFVGLTARQRTRRAPATPLRSRRTFERGSQRISGSTALVNKSPSQIVVTNIDQFILPSCIHAGTILDAIFTKDSLMGIDLHTFTWREFIPPACTQAEVDGIRDSIFDKAVEYFKDVMESTSAAARSSRTAGWTRVSIRP